MSHDKSLNNFRNGKQKQGSIWSFFSSKKDCTGVSEGVASNAAEFCVQSPLSSSDSASTSSGFCSRTTGQNISSRDEDSYSKQQTFAQKHKRICSPVKHDSLLNKRKQNRSHCFENVQSRRSLTGPSTSLFGNATCVDEADVSVDLFASPVAERSVEATEVRGNAQCVRGSPTTRDAANSALSAVVSTEPQCQVVDSLADSVSDARIAHQSSVTDGLGEELDLDMEFESAFLEELKPNYQLRGTDLSLPTCWRFDRYVVHSVDTSQCDDGGCMYLRLRQPGQSDSHACRTVRLTDSWSDTAVCAGDIVHLVPPTLSLPTTGIVNMDAGVNTVSGMNGALFVVQPDRLLSGTSVVAAVVCARRAVLAEIYRGAASLDPANQSMLLGTVVHRLFQQALTENWTESGQLTAFIEELVGDPAVLRGVYSSRFSVQQLVTEAGAFVEPLLAWLRCHTRRVGVGRRAEASPCVERVVDIEENFWCPRLGVKGKVDATVMVEGGRSRSGNAPDLQTIPLELKTGRASFSVEHQGQVALYSMMNAERRDCADDGGTKSLLVYLRTGDTRVVSTGRHQRRDLIQLRNLMAHHLTRPVPVQPQPPTTTSDRGWWRPSLPAPICQRRVCATCPYSAVCHTFLSADQTHCVPEAMAHVSAAHQRFVRHWSWLVLLEAAPAAAAGNVALSRLWTVSAERRHALCWQGDSASINTAEVDSGASEGFTLASCRLLDTQAIAVANGDCGASGWLHRFSHSGGARVTAVCSLGDRVVVSTSERLALASGTVSQCCHQFITVALERGLSCDSDDKDVGASDYHIDKWSFGSSTLVATNLANIVRLLDNSPNADNLRQLIIERRRPVFAAGLCGDVVRRGRAILKPLNRPQQRALLRAMMADDYLLIQGMPGTGKTTTIVALIRLLVLMGHSVLLTSHTHSAVDTVLLKLRVYKTPFLRVGAPERMHPLVRPYSCEKACQSASTVEQLDRIYNSVSVVGVTCLGVGHDMFSRRTFDLCILDEASQVVLPTALGPLLLCRRFVLVGDSRQLAPVVCVPAARQHGLEQSLFDLLLSSPHPPPYNSMNEESAAAEDEQESLGFDRGDEHVVQLTVQYRMNERLMSLSNELIYAGAMMCDSERVRHATLPPPAPCQAAENVAGASAPSWLTAVLDRRLSHSAVLLDTGDLNWHHSVHAVNGVTNAAEARLTAFVAAQLAQQLAIDIEGAGGAADGELVGVIAPYRGQVRLLRDLLSTTQRPSLSDASQCTQCHIETNTVDQFQGRDKLAIVVSCTCSYPTSDPLGSDGQGGDILADARRLNVMLTRARCKLVLVGDRHTLTGYETFRRLLCLLAPEHVVALSCNQLPARFNFSI